MPPKGYFRLSPGREVRLRYGYLVTCTSVVKNDKGEVVEVHCTYDPATRGGNTPDGRKVKSTIHWVSAANAVDAEVRIYENLFTKENPNEVEEGQDFTANLNPNSLEVIATRSWNRRWRTSLPVARYQFERLGYFCVDPDSKPGKPVFNRTVALKDTWAKVEKKQGGRARACKTKPRAEFTRGALGLSSSYDYQQARHRSQVLLEESRLSSDSSSDSPTDQGMLWTRRDSNPHLQLDRQCAPITPLLRLTI